MNSGRTLCVALGWILATSGAACAPRFRDGPPPRDLSPPPGNATALTTRAELDVAPPEPARLEVSEASGIAAEHLQAMYAPAAEQLHRCIPGRGRGKLVLRVTRRDGALHVAAAPGITLDAGTRQCALDALSAVPLPETGSNASAPQIPPSGFTSLFTVAW